MRTILSAVLVVFTILSAAGPAVSQTTTKSQEEQEQGQSTRDFLDTRISSILFSQTDRLATALRNDEDIQVNQGTGNANLEGFSGPLWTSLNARQSELDGNDLELGIATVGGDIVNGPNGIFGLMLQSDFAFQDGDDGGTFDATGFMFGVYGIRQWRSVVVDVRLMAGKTSNDIKNFGERADDVESNRWLAAVQLLSFQELGNGLLLIPNGGVSLFEDKMEAYTIGINNIDAETISYGQANLGARLHVPVTLNDAQGNLILGGTTIAGFGDSAGDQVPDDLRGRVDLGIEFFQTDDWQVSVGLFADGLGHSDYQALGLDLGVTLWF